MKLAEQVLGEAGVQALSDDKLIDRAWTIKDQIYKLTKKKHTVDDLLKVNDELKQISFELKKRGLVK